MAIRRVILGIVFCAMVCAFPSGGLAGLGLLNYNVSGIGPAGSDAREALQRIVDYFDPDVIIFQEAKGTTYPQEFLAANPEYEGFYSLSADGAHNRQMIMSKYDIIDESVREVELGEGSLRKLLAATIHLPGPRDLEVFTAHWTASSASIRDNESAASVALLQSYRSAHPGAFYVYAGDFNDVDSCPRITSLLAPRVGLTLFTPVNPNNGSSATINSDPGAGTYLDRRIDYIFPSDTVGSYGVSGRVLNTWSYTPESIPPPLKLSDTISASDHLPIYAWVDIPVTTDPILGDANADALVDGADYTIWADHYKVTGVRSFSEGGWGFGNFNEDNTVDGADYTLWADNCQPVGSASAPEPAALALLAAGGLMLVLHRRR